MLHHTATAQPGPTGFSDLDWDAPRSHLLGELRAELDWVTGELSSAVARLSAIESDYNRATFPQASGRRAVAVTTREEADARQESLAIDRLFDLQRIARQRVDRIEEVYAIGRCYWLVAVVAMNLRRRLAAGRPDLLTDRTKRQAILDLAAAVHAYCWDGPSDEADDAIRDAWLRIESGLPGTLH